MAMYLADRVIVYHLQPGIGVTASKPQSLLSCMNQFLKSLEVTFRRDLVNFRRRINKKGSQKDAEQKANGNYFFYYDGAEDDSDVYGSCRFSCACKN